jgi:hypothetical protein
MREKTAQKSRRVMGDGAESKIVLESRVMRAVAQ